MVQSRQISVFCLAYASGWFPNGRDLAVEAASHMIDRFLEADSKPGWVQSIDREGNPYGTVRDLYAHAFVIFALARLLKLAPSKRVEGALQKTLLFLDERMAIPDGGFAESVPATGGYRRQNPHMHLFEAFLELVDARRMPSYHSRARGLCDLALGRFYDSEVGAIREVFDRNWIVQPYPGGGSVEPGHQFEWAWLLRRNEDLVGVSHEQIVAMLLSNALRFGMDRLKGRIVDEVGEDFRIRKRTSRSWPHAEALKALSAETRRGADFETEVRALFVDSKLYTVRGAARRLDGSG